MNKLLAALAMVVITLACGGAASGGQPSPSPVHQLGTLTLSESGCVYQGAGTFSAGSVVIHAANQTADQLFVSMLLLNSGHQYSELATHIADEQKRILAGTDPIGPPTYVVEMFTDDVPPNSTLPLTRLLDVVGTYGLVCGRVKERTSLGIWLFGPITGTS